MLSRCGALAFGAAVLSVCTPASAAPTYISVDGSSQVGAQSVLNAIDAKGDAIGNGFVSFVYKADGTIHVVKNHPNLTAINKQGAFTGDIAKGHTDERADGIVGRFNGKVTTTFVVPDGKRSTEITYGTGINDSGEITGDYANADDNYVSHGFIRDSGGVITTFDAPGAGTDGDQFEGTRPLAINGSGVITGYFRDSARVYHCFIRDWEGAFTTVDPNSSHSTSCNAINDSGEIAGSFGDGTAAHGFVRSADGTIKTFDALGSAQSTVAQSINSKGVIAGHVIDSAGVEHGFVRTANGTITVFDVPDFGSGPTKTTAANAVNDKGEIAGFYIDGANFTHGFIRKP